MTYPNPHPVIREKTFLSSLVPGREEVPLVVAAVGVALLTTADVQPLMPPGAASIFVSGVPKMAHAWQILIVALLVAVTAAAVLRGWRRIPGPAAILVCTVSAAAFLINVIILFPAVSVADLMTRRVNWILYGPMFVLPFLACAATVLLALAHDKRFASGVLLATGAAGYLFYFQQLDYYLGIRVPQFPAPGRATFAGMIGAGVVLVAGLAGRGHDAPEPLKAARSAALAAKITAAAAAIAVAVAVFYEFVAVLQPSATRVFVQRFLPGIVVFAVAPAVLAAGACLAAAGRRDPDRPCAAGVLITAGFLTLTYFVASHVFGWLVPLRYMSGQALLSDDIGVAGGLAFLLAGFTLLASRGAANAGAVPVPAPDAAVPVPVAGAQRFTETGDPARSDTTRYLCAAAHFDDRFARQVIGQVAGNPHRAVVPSLGVDLGTVLRHCFAARRRQVLRDVLITAIVLGILPIVLDFRNLTGFRDAAVLVVLAAIVAFTERWVSRYRVAARQLSRGAFDPTRAPWLTAEEKQQVDRVQASVHGNISVYGTYSPFVGSGSAQGGWSFAVNLAKGKEPAGRNVRLAPKPFEVQELYQAVQQDIEELGLAGLLIEDRLLVDGQSIRDDTRFIQDRMAQPVTTIGAERLRELVHTPDLQNRAYQCVRMQDWRGDLVLSVFINFTRRGSGLLAEVQHYLLAPVRKPYREVDQMASRPTVRRWNTELRHAPATMTAALVQAPFRTAGTLWRMGTRWNHERVIKRHIDDDPEYNFGAQTSIRELAQSAHYRKYFQQVDRGLNTKLIDRQVLDSIMTFLDAHDIDISQFEEQRTTILNQGLLISGGQVSAGSVAVGEHSRAGVTQFLQNVPNIRKQGENP
jgi:hypothetical protein